MGSAKDRESEDWENGYSSGSDKTVCEKHIRSKALLKFINDNGSPDLECSFCLESGLDFGAEVVNKLHMDDFMKEIMHRVKRFFDHAANGVGFCSKEGGYLLPVYDASELIYEQLMLDADDDVIEEIIESICHDEWAESKFYGEDYSDHLTNLWRLFSDSIKNPAGPKPRNVPSKKKILSEIGQFIAKINLITTLPKKESFFDQEIYFFRARQHGKKGEVICSTDIGPPPTKFAGLNRFSKKGDSIFYGAEDEETAIKEVVNRNSKDKFLSIGKFSTAKQLNLVDLREIFNIQFFDIDDIEMVEPAWFLRNFVKSITKKLELEDKPEKEYIPPQVVTEYIRYQLSAVVGKPIHGIVYKSAQNPGRDSYAIFADPEKCSEKGQENEDTLLVFDSITSSDTDVSGLPWLEQNNKVLSPN